MPTGSGEGGTMTDPYGKVPKWVWVVLASPAIAAVVGIALRAMGLDI